MGRKKNYDRDTLIDQAMDIFRDHGFAGTSTQMLVEGLGVNRFSLYSEFDNKQKLFDVALKRYNDEVVNQNFGPLEAPDASLEEIQSLFEFFACAINSPSAGRGCLLCNTAVEFGAEDPSGEEFVKRYFERISKAFLKALGNAKDKGLISEEISTRKEADFFTATVLGLFVMIRANAQPSIVKNAAKMAIGHLKSLSA